ncbi:MAG: hypothetical protein ACOY82_08180 [Pseudomonadota bacterium]
MSHRRLRTTAVVLAAVLSFAAPSSQAAPPAGRYATPTERAALIRAFVLKWGGYAERVYGVDVRVWSRRMVPTFARGDADNLRLALRRDTFEGALAALSGVGHRLDDDRVLDALAAARPETPANRLPIPTKALGDLGQDLVFTPITPCRIVDTRFAGGQIAAGQTRSFNAAGQSSYAGQGGNAGNCGMQTEVPTAVALNVTAVVPAGAGYATVFPYNTTRPDTASVNYATGAIVNNAIIAKVPNPPASFDFSIYTFAASDYVVDIVGYFAPPRATALQCLDTSYATVTINAGATGQATAPACATGYTSVHLDCESSSWFMPIVYSTQKGGGLCGARNGGTTSATLSAARRCCRVPGR